MTTNETPLELVVRIMDRLKRAMRSACKTMGDASLAEEAFSDVVLERIDRVVSLYDPTKGSSLEGYVIRTMKLYAWKWARRNRKFIGQVRLPRGNSAGLEDSAAAADSKVEEAVMAEDVLEQLSEYDRWLLDAHVVRGYTFKQMRIAMGCKKGFARAEFNRALRRARALCGLDETGEGAE